VDLLLLEPKAPLRVLAELVELVGMELERGLVGIVGFNRDVDL
jgi:hypothetical protein